MMLNHLIRSVSGYVTHRAVRVSIHYIWGVRHFIGDEGGTPNFLQGKKYWEPDVAS